MPKKLCIGFTGIDPDGPAQYFIDDAEVSEQRFMDCSLDQLLDAMRYEFSVATYQHISHIPVNGSVSQWEAELERWSSGRLSGLAKGFGATFVREYSDFFQEKTSCVVRPGFSEFVEDLPRYRFQILLVETVSHLGDYIEVGAVFASLKKQGVRIVSERAPEGNADSLLGRFTLLMDAEGLVR